MKQPIRGRQRENTDLMDEQRIRERRCSEVKGPIEVGLMFSSGPIVFTV